MKSVRLRVSLKVTIKVGIFGVVLLATPYKTSASDSNQVRCYRVDESELAKVDQSPYLLCLKSADTEKFPKSIVTVSYSKEESGGRGLASVEPNDPNSNKKLHVLAKRYYIKFDANSYGRRGSSTPGVRFDPATNSVTVSFIHKESKKFFYKQLD